MQLDIDILIIALTIIALDMIFLGVFGFGQRFTDMITMIQKEDTRVKIIPTIFVYALMVVGQYIFVKPLVQSSTDAIYYGGLFGLVTFGIFNLTNLAMIGDYRLSITLTDMAWGVVLNAVTAWFVLNYKTVFG